MPQAYLNDIVSIHRCNIRYSKEAYLLGVLHVGGEVECRGPPPLHQGTGLQDLDTIEDTGRRGEEMGAERGLG